MAFELRIDGSYAAGVLFVDDSAAPWADLQCARLGDGAVQISGRTLIGSSGMVDVQQTEVTFDATRGLAGTLRLSIVSSSGTTRTLTATIASASQTAFPVALGSNFTGTWYGRDERIDCTGTCAAVPATHQTTIRLVQSGSTVIGDLGFSINGTIGDDALDLTGLAANAAATLAGVTDFQPDRFGTGVTRVGIEDFSIRVDGLGRLVGDYRIATDGIWTVSFTHMPYHTEEHRRLVGVFRRF
jgi:hypothetical protein